MFNKWAGMKVSSFYTLFRKENTLHNILHEEERVKYGDRPQVTHDRGNLLGLTKVGYLPSSRAPHPQKWPPYSSQEAHWPSSFIWTQFSWEFCLRSNPATKEKKKKIKIERSWGKEWRKKELKPNIYFKGTNILDQISFCDRVRAHWNQSLQSTALV